MDLRPDQELTPTQWLNAFRERWEVFYREMEEKLPELASLHREDEDPWREMPWHRPLRLRSRPLETWRPARRIIDTRWLRIRYDEAGSLFHGRFTARIWVRGLEIVWNVIPKKEWVPRPSHWWLLFGKKKQ